MKPDELLPGDAVHLHGVQNTAEQPAMVFTGYLPDGDAVGEFDYDTAKIVNQARKLHPGEKVGIFQYFNKVSGLYMTSIIPVAAVFKK